jgi:DNA-binding GntR family transcriptional regulator
VQKNADLEPIEAINLNDVVYQRLRQRILTQAFAPGERLDLSQLETALQVSRTPLKNALTRLEVEGLVEIQPRRGTFVAATNVEKLEEAYKIRSAFELYVALCLFKYLTAEDIAFFAELRCDLDALAQAGRGDWSPIIGEYLELDQQLHERFVARGGTPRMLELHQQMNVHRQLVPILPQFKNHDFEAMHFEHEQIFDALEAMSPERLSAVLLNHLEASRIRALKRAAQVE